MECASEVRVEDVVDDRIQHGAAVLQPLESGDRLRRDVGLTALASTVHDVRHEERQIEHDEDGEQDAEDAHGASAAVRALHRARPPTVRPRVGGREAAGALGLRPVQVVAATGVASSRAATGSRVDGVVDRRCEQRLDLARRLRTRRRIPDLCAAAR